MGWIESTKPSSFGLDKYEAWRPTQAEAIEDVLDSSKRFVVLQAPPGIGKSGIGAALAKLNGEDRTGYLTVTKALMSQVSRDFSDTGLAAIKGANAYECRDNPGHSCEEGRLDCEAQHECGEHPGGEGCGVSCSGWEGSCPRRIAYKNAVNANWFVSNYSLWFYVNRHKPSALMQDVHTLILDEAHSAPEVISDALSISIYPHDFRLLKMRPPEDHKDPGAWSAWAAVARENAKNDIEIMHYLTAKKGRLGGKLAFKRLLERLGELADVENRNDWAIENDGGLMVKATPVWPYLYAKYSLFFDVPKIVLMSGTIMPLHLKLLGVKGADYSFHTYPYTFKNAGKNYHIPTSKVSAKAFESGKGDEDLWLRTIVDFLDKRRDRSGIIHTVSYTWAKRILAGIARLKPELLALCATHDAGETETAVAAFKSSRGPQWLFSPAITTGYDFPSSQCEFVLWPKLPWVPTQSEVMRLRIERNKLYAGSLMIEQLVQGSLRGRRFDGDSCEVAILDDSWFWARRAYSSCIPAWFRVGMSRRVPSPPPSIRSRESAAVSINP